MSETNTKGRVTIPTDMDVIPQTLEILKKWGADAIRDCDGTDFPQELKDVDAKIYSTYYTTRKDNAWAKANPDEIQQMYLMTPFYSVPEGELSIKLMKGLYPEMLAVNPKDKERPSRFRYEGSTPEVPVASFDRNATTSNKRASKQTCHD